MSDNEDSKKKKKARKALVVFLGRLRKTCGICDKAQDWYDFLKQNLDPVISEFGNEIPDEFKKRIEDARKLTDSTKEGINRACQTLQKDISKTIKSLPKGFGLGSIVLGGFIVSAVAVGVAVTYLSFASVKVVIKNQGCETINTVAWMPVKFPGLELPNEPIPSGGSATAKVPPLTFMVDSTGGSVKLSAFSLNMKFDLTEPGIDFIFNGSSLLGNLTEINLGQRPQHELVVKCG